jgi:hypothetical protein
MASNPPSVKSLKGAVQAAFNGACSSCNVCGIGQASLKPRRALLVTALAQINGQSIVKSPERVDGNTLDGAWPRLLVV